MGLGLAVGMGMRMAIVAGMGMVMVLGTGTVMVVGMPVGMAAGLVMAAGMGDGAPVDPTVAMGGARESGRGDGGRPWVRAWRWERPWV